MEILCAILCFVFHSSNREKKESPEVCHYSIYELPIDVLITDRLLKPEHGGETKKNL
jgi:hypothetical protein